MNQYRIDEQETKASLIRDIRRHGRDFPTGTILTLGRRYQPPRGEVEIAARTDDGFGFVVNSSDIAII